MSIKEITSCDMREDFAPPEMHVTREEIELFYLAARRGHANAMCFLGDCYKVGKGVKRDDQKAVTFYRKSARKGFVVAIHNLAICYYYGEGVEQNGQATYVLLRTAANRGDTMSQSRFSMLYSGEVGSVQRNIGAISWPAEPRLVETEVEEDEQKAMQLVREPARQGPAELISKL